ncbi:peptide MFS transporter [Sphingomonas sp.]|uniref:peptide MFS transporter n=1 Tax=Sphingomonas sp. TaxID=28214 RepID=UPI002DBA3DEC|nr:peptide MFS transporter [Sphingomonas sp.]HEU4967418.1 peptide MFS transporter [Sphingomonas sp.]
MTAAETESSPRDTSFFGHPKGLGYLAFTEAWERFSYYGMTSMLALYMIGQLLTPGHAENVLGLAALRHALEFRGPIGNQAFASLIFGWYSGLVYFTPVLGGLIADRWLGARRTVVVGALLMSAGHIAMAFDASFLIALVLLIVGSGCLKGNISAQVGHLYPAAAESWRTQGYTIFSAAINVGAVLGPLGCGALAAAYGWHYGFGLAGALMILALIIYLAGQRYLPDGARASKSHHHPPLTPAERTRTWMLILVIVLTVLPNIAYPMIWNVGIVWISEHVSRATPWGEIPAGWFNSVDAFASIVAVPPLVALWRWQARRGQEPGDIAKIGIGAALTGISALVITAGCLLTPAGSRVAVLWPLLSFAGMGVAFLYFWPVLLALISEAAPAKMNATLMGGAFLSLFVGSVLMGWVGSFYSQMTPARFWALDGAIGLAGGILVFLFKDAISAALGRDDPPADTTSSDSSQPLVSADQT